MMAIAPLPPSDGERLAACEEVIALGMQSFVAVGEALLTVRDERLYRAAGFSTFAEYTHGRWGFSRQHAYRLMDAASVVGNLSPLGDKFPGNEREARPLAVLAPEEQIEAWQEVRAVAEQAGMSAALVRQIVERRQAHFERRPDVPAPIPLPRVDPENRFQVVYADPPWRYDFSLDRADAIENQYATMTTQQVADLPVQPLLAADAVLFLWTTSPKLPDGLEVLNSWGFQYRTSAVWIKPGSGMGYYFRVNHEILLLGIRGRPGVPEYANRPNSDFHAPRGRHSEKPTCVVEAIESMFPTERRLELFARVNRPGWLAWGNEVASG